MKDLGQEISVIDGWELADQVEHSRLAIHELPVQRPRLQRSHLPVRSRASSQAQKPRAKCQLSRP